MDWLGEDSHNLHPCLDYSLARWFSSTIYYICLCPSGQYIFDESVFASSLIRNLAISTSTGIRQCIHHLVWFIVPISGTFHTGVGYCLFVLGLARASNQINDKCSTLFFVASGTIAIQSISNNGRQYKTEALLQNFYRCY